MSVKLIAPGKRRNKTYYIIGSLDGNKVEKSTGTDDRKLAQEVLNDFLETYSKRKKLKKFMSYAEATDRYIDFRKPCERDEAWLKRICSIIGPKPIVDVVRDDIIRVANLVYPKAKNSTKNRAVITPASAVLQYASENEWRTPIKVKRFPESAIKPRFISPEDQQKLLNSVKDDDAKHTMLLWQFRQGDRITDIAKITWDQIDLDKKLFYRHQRKTDDYDTVPLDDEICELLRKINDRSGYVFKWHTRWSVYNWLRPLCKSLGVTYSPHMGRHTLGKSLNDAGGGLKSIMTILGHKNPKTALRYHNTDTANLADLKRRAVGKTEGYND